MSKVEQAKRKAAYKAVDDHVTTDMILGIGSGSTIVYAVERVADKVKKDNVKIRCIPTSFQADQLIHEYGLPISDLNTDTTIDVCIDGADEVDEDLTLIKGGGGCHVQEKIIASASKKLVIVADHRKKSTRLGQQWNKGLPLEVLPICYKLVQKRIEANFGGKVELRYGTGKMGPVVSDNGNFLMDWLFTGSRKQSEWQEIDQQLKLIPGIVETGLFINMASVVYIGHEDGSVELIKSK